MQLERKKQVPVLSLSFYKKMFSEITKTASMDRTSTQGQVRVETDSDKTDLGQMDKDLMDLDQSVKDLMDLVQMGKVSMDTDPTDQVRTDLDRTDKDLTDLDRTV